MIGKYEKLVATHLKLAKLGCCSLEAGSKQQVFQDPPIPCRLDGQELRFLSLFVPSARNPTYSLVRAFLLAFQMSTISLFLLDDSGRKS